MEFIAGFSLNLRAFRKSGGGVEDGETAARAQAYFPFEVNLSGLDT
jgi:hypothetical protein